MFKRQWFAIEKPIAANYDTPSGVSCIQIYYPDDLEHLYVLQGLISKLANPAFWDGSEADRDYRAYLWEVAYEQTDWQDCIENSMIDLDVWFVNGSVSGGVQTYSAQAAQPFGYTVFTDTTANRYITMPTYFLKAGGYTVDLWYIKNTSSGIVELIITDPSGVVDTAFSGLDQYATPLAVRFSRTGSFDIPADGLYSFVLRNVGSKNAASSGYSVNGTSLHIRQLT